MKILKNYKQKQFLFLKGRLQRQQQTRIVIKLANLCIIIAELICMASKSELTKGSSENRNSLH